MNDLDKRKKVASRGSEDGKGWDDHKHGAPPTELVDLLLRTIALDSSGLKDGTKIDQRSAERLFEMSSWAKEGKKKRQELEDVMKDIHQELKEKKKSLEALSVRDLLRRDWKGDA